MTWRVSARPEGDRWSDFEHVRRGVEVGLYIDYLLR
jgi:hypothetical protein